MASPYSLKGDPPTKQEREEWLKKVTEDGYLIRDAPMALKADKELALAACTQCGQALEWVAPELRSDKDVVLAAVTEDPTALWHQIAPRANGTDSAYFRGPQRRDNIPQWADDITAEVLAPFERRKKGNVEEEKPAEEEKRGGWKGSAA